MLRHYFTNPIRKIKPDGGYTSIFRNIGFIGDSLSSGEHESFENGKKGFHDYYEYSWGQYIARKCGLTAYNFSQGGLTAIKFFEYIKKNNPFDKKKACQAYMIALGLNDMTHLKEYYPDGFGTFADVNLTNEDKNKKSYVGQYVRIIQKLRKLEPKCRIFVITTPKERPESKEKRKHFNMIRKFLLELPKHFEFVYVIDLRKYAPIYSKRFGKKYFLGGHMSAIGYKFTADMISTYVDYIITHHFDDFKQVGFIGKNIYNHNEKW
ncbi:MAG: SGNH/GDSL hydrolase family protein [Bacilli bacterium]|nr:SGNH/GDSL hydrolase family protein [Bacilli bacterium]